MAITARILLVVGQPSCHIQPSLTEFSITSANPRSSEGVSSRLGTGSCPSGGVSGHLRPCMDIQRRIRVFRGGCLFNQSVSTFSGNVMLSRGVSSHLWACQAIQRRIMLFSGVLGHEACQVIKGRVMSFKDMSNH